MSAVALLALVLPCLPSDLHGLVYSYLDWREKKILISLCKEIYSLSRSYREIRLNRPASIKYALDESFRDRVSSLALPYRVALNYYGEEIFDAFLVHLGEVGTLNVKCCCGLTNAGLAYLGNVKEIDLACCHQITDEGLRHLGNLQSLDRSHRL
jgi:hypothetical protein